MKDWKEQLEEFVVSTQVNPRLLDEDKVIAFIQTEIIEKLIEESVNLMGDVENIYYAKQQLRAKWL
jgi:hypothetical protein